MSLLCALCVKSFPLFASLLHYFSTSLLHRFLPCYNHLMPKNSLLILGLMSGTSADGIETALVRASGAPPYLNSKLLNHTSLPIPPPIRKKILQIAEGTPLPAAEISQLNFRLGQLFAQAALSACKKFRISPKRLDLIASHGQTVFHQGPSASFSPLTTRHSPLSSVPSTLQLGDGSVIANLTGVTTISDFRPADMAAGGQGAPLVPFADYLLYRHAKHGRVSLNLGGIANVTVIPAAAKPQDVFAFDTGPANILIDALVSHFTHGRQRFDKNASLARRGHLNNALIYRLMKDPYLKLHPPKSTGREHFGARYVKDLLNFARKHEIRPDELLYTVTYFTAESVVDALRRFVLPKHKISQLIVSGGGARNPLLMLQLELLLQIDSRSNSVFSSSSSSSTRHSPLATRHFPAIEVIPSTHLGVPTEAKEAYAFALLAHETFHHRPSNLPSATGAHRPAILGKISYA
jgi:anhydro-N-acetylmuramic acid kinase